MTNHKSIQNPQVLIDRLVAEGVYTALAKELVKRFPEEVDRQLDAIPYRENVKNRTAFLIKAIREAYPIPQNLDERKAATARFRELQKQRTEKQGREEYKQKFTAQYFDYLRSELNRIEETETAAMTEFREIFTQFDFMTQHLSADETESLRLIEFEIFAAKRPELQVLSFWQWDEQYNPEKKPLEVADAVVEKPVETGSEAQEEKKSLRSKKVDLIDLVQDRATLFHDIDYKHYATVQVNGHVETYPIDSKNFRIWLSGLYFENAGSALFGDTMKETLATLQALAQFCGETKEVYLRLAEQNGNIYLDLSNREWQVVEISAEGWKVISAADSPVKFCRRQAMMPLPVPIGGGRLDELREFINAPDDETWVLIASWLVMTLHPSGPYPVLMVTGEQGSAKTTACRLLRALVDPNRADLRAVAKDERDLMIGASNSWILAYDNLSGISQDVADSLCRIATGAGFTTRQLHSDNEETIFAVKRPIITNGIIDANNYPDLLDRSVAIFMRAIDDKTRREEQELWGSFNLAKPRILGALLSAVSYALKHKDSIELTDRPRMADFARWAIAAEKAIGLAPGTFWEVFYGNRLANHENALDNPLAIAICDFLESLPDLSWSGRGSDLHVALKAWLIKQNKMDANDGWWPKSPNALSGKIRRLAPNFRAKGYEVHCGRTNQGSLMTIRKVISNTPPEI